MKFLKIVSIVAIIGVIFLEGNEYMAQKNVREEQELLNVEKEVARAMINTFENLKKIKILNINFYQPTGSYDVRVEISDDHETLDFSFSFFKGEKQISGYIIHNDNLQKRGKSNSQVNVQYTNGKEETL